MRYGTICSGIEAPTVAWHGFGWAPQWFSEIEPFPKAVLAHHYPEVPDLGDMTKVNWSDYAGSVDLVAGGTPCQAFSVAGLRKGLADPRGNLTLEFLRVLDAVRPTWVVWENVPGVLSVDGGRAFGAFLGGLGQLGYGFAYRVLDAQYFGVPQRRRRVFVVGHSGDWRLAAAVLFERHSLQGHPAPRREAGAPVASLTANGVGTCGADDNQGQAGHLIAGGFAYGGGNTSGPVDVSTCLTRHGNRQDFDTETFIAQCITGNVTHTLKAEGHDASEDGTGRGTPIIAFDPAQVTSAANRSNPQPGDPCHTLAKGAHAPAIAFPGRMSGTQYASTENLAPSLGALNPTAVAVSLRGREGGATAELSGEVMPALRCCGGGGDKPHTLNGMSVRRLTPRECERLQGFPDDYTLIPHGRRIRHEKLDRDFIKYQMRGNPKHLTRDDVDRLAADGPRYKTLGNSWAVVVGKWIGQRIELVRELMEAA